MVGGLAGGDEGFVDTRLILNAMSVTGSCCLCRLDSLGVKRGYCHGGLCEQGKCVKAMWFSIPENVVWREKASGQFVSFGVVRPEVSSLAPAAPSIMGLLPLSAPVKPAYWSRLG